ncbi:hypothetical protein Tco_0873651 [Tanacetum coccineum]|uniref:Uncharacterized protein n=1 Tax=Tanacetum coccineum TaxID=301880 RepID=A0ABQ5BJH7_9ASTR
MNKKIGILVADNGGRSTIFGCNICYVLGPIFDSRRLEFVQERFKQVKFENSDEVTKVKQTRCSGRISKVSQWALDHKGSCHEGRRQGLEARRAAEKAYDVAKVDERVNKAVAASNRSANAARVAAVKAVQKQRPQRPNKSNGGNLANGDDNFYMKK